MRAYLVVIGALVTTPVLAAYPIAGLNPAERPAGAPTIKEPARGADWEAVFFKGVAKPLPASLSWSRDQGSWYTPFNRPGMPGRFDIRGWHTPVTKK